MLQLGTGRQAYAWNARLRGQVNEHVNLAWSAPRRDELANHSNLGGAAKPGRRRADGLCMGMLEKKAGRRFRLLD